VYVRFVFLVFWFEIWLEENNFGQCRSMFVRGSSHWLQLCFSSCLVFRRRCGWGWSSVYFIFGQVAYNNVCMAKYISGYIYVLCYILFKFIRSRYFPTLQKLHRTCYYIPTFFKLFLNIRYYADGYRCKTWFCISL